MTAPERIWARPDYNECWPKRLEEEDVEYSRADLAAVQPALDKLIAEAVDVALKQAAFWVEEAMVIVAPEGYPQRAALDSYRKQFSTLVLASNKGMV